MVNKQHGMNELANADLGTVLSFDVERLNSGQAAGGLNVRSRPERLAPCEVILQGNAVPIVHPERDKGTVVIAVPETGTRGDIA